MKLQISFDMLNLDQALEIASKVAIYADILEVGTLLLYKHGSVAVEQFKKNFPQQTILADSKIVDRGKQAVTLFGQAGADWVSIMAGTNNSVIHAACTAAHEMNKKIMLDLLDSSSIGQSAMEAKSLGVDALLVHQSYEEPNPLVFLDKWEIVKGNTQLPIFVAAKIKRDTIEEVLKINPDGIIVGKSITEAEDPAAEAAFFKELCSNN